MKRCTQCGIEKPDEAFEMQPSRGRRRAECRECRIIAQREWRAKRKQNPPQSKLETKKCKRCQEVKPINEFSPSNPGYFRARCKACEVALDREKRREQYQNDPTGRFYWPFENEAGILVKRCSHCHTEKPVSDFYSNNPKSLHSKCKECDKAIKRADYVTNPEKQRAVVRESARRHPDRKRECWQRWEANNKEHRAQYVYEYKDRRAELTRIWNKTYPERRAEHGQRRRARIMNASKVEIIDRKAIFERDKWTCYLCGQICTPQNVTLDHVIPLVRGGTHTADNLRVACYLCNCRKGVKYVHEFLK